MKEETPFEKIYKNSNGSFRKTARNVSPEGGHTHMNHGHKPFYAGLRNGEEYEKLSNEPGINSKWGGKLEPSIAKDSIGSYGQSGYTFTNINPKRKWVQIVMYLFYRKLQQENPIEKSELVENLKKLTGQTATVGNYAALLRANLISKEKIGNKFYYSAGPNSEKLYNELDNDGFSTEDIFGFIWN